MLTLVVYDNLYAQADQNNNVLCVVRGYTINHETEKKDYFKLNHVYLNNSSTFIYRCPVNVTTIIESITLSNNTGLTATNVSIYLTTGAVQNKLYSISLLAGGYAIIDQNGVKNYASDGELDPQNPEAERELQALVPSEPTPPPDKGGLLKKFFGKS